MMTALFEAAGGGLLFLLGDQRLPIYQQEADVEVMRYTPGAESFLHRTLEFSRELTRIVRRQRDNLRICHFRDPWSGVPILTNKRSHTAAIYEINGLPSIELPYRFP